ncbi:hypothetical protein [Streptomyces sp. NPDC101149]|uniref:hypothetical protein n=1 Tax=Streptomyces sp. NPDC101149 TaxID=3366113 RepID=UPI003816162D
MGNAERTKAVKGAGGEPLPIRKCTTAAEQLTAPRRSALPAAVLFRLRHTSSRRGRGAPS